MAQTNESNIEVDNTKQLIGLDGEIQSIAKLMQDNIAWLTKSWGRAKTINDKLVGKDTQEPMIYISDSEYYSTYPNDAYNAFSFWGVAGQSVGKDQGNGIMTSSSNFEAPVFCIVWANLKAIDKTKDFIYTQELIKDVLKQLRRKSNFTLTQIYDERVEDIFKGYSLKPEHRDLLKFPFQAFRIEGKLNYTLKLC